MRDAAVDVARGPDDEGDLHVTEQLLGPGRMVHRLGSGADERHAQRGIRAAAGGQHVEDARERHRRGADIRQRLTVEHRRGRQGGAVEKHVHALHPRLTADGQQLDAGMGGAGRRHPQQLPAGDVGAAPGDVVSRVEPAAEGVPQHVGGGADGHDGTDGIGIQETHAPHCAVHPVPPSGPPGPWGAAVRRGRQGRPQRLRVRRRAAVRPRRWPCAPRRRRGRRPP